MHGCRLADPPVTGCAESQHVDIGPFGGGCDDLPGAHAVDGLASTIRTALAREEQRLVILQVVLARPEEQLTRQADVCSREMGRLDGRARTSLTRAPVAQSVMSSRRSRSQAAAAITA